MNVIIKNKVGTSAEVSENNELLVRSNVAKEAEVISYTASDTVITLANKNNKRTALRIYNNSDKDMYVKEGDGDASISLFTYKLVPGATLIVNDFTGMYSAIWPSSPSGNCMVTSLI